MYKCIRLVCILVWLTSLALGSEYHGQVTLNSLPIPGAIVTASQGDKKLIAITDEQGTYTFPDLSDGNWTIDVGMTGFSSVKQDVTIAPDTPAAKWELKLLPSDQIKIESKLPPAPVPQTPQADKPAEAALPAPDPNQDASDGLLINGSVNNGAASPFRQGGAFGNNRRGPKGLYTGGIGGIFGNSVLDAQPFSLTGQNTPKLAYNNLTGVLTFGGPFRIPHVLTNGPNFFVGYQWTRNRSAATLPALLPDTAARNGVVSNSVLDPLTGAPFSGGLIPQSRISPQARALLKPLPAA